VLVDEEFDAVGFVAFALCRLVGFLLLGLFVFQYAYAFVAVCDEGGHFADIFSQFS
jgi:hypothetical protein